MDLRKYMKQILFVEICLGIIFCSCSMTKHDEKTHVKWCSPNEDNIVMVGYIESWPTIGRDLDNDMEVDLIEYYKCDGNSLPYTIDLDGCIQFNENAKCEKVGFALWQ